MIILGVLRTWLQGAGQFAVCVKIITGFWWNYVSCFLTNEMFCCHNNKNLAERGQEVLLVITDCLSTMNVKFVWKTLSSSFLSVKFCLSDDDTSMKRITNRIYLVEIQVKSVPKTMIIVTSRVENFWQNREFNPTAWCQKSKHPIKSSISIYLDG